MGNFEIYLLDPDKLWSNIKESYNKHSLLTILNIIVTVYLDYIAFIDLQAFFSRECNFSAIVGDLLFCTIINLYLIFVIIRIADIKPHKIYEIIHILLLLAVWVLWDYKYNWIDYILSLVK